MNHHPFLVKKLKEEEPVGGGFEVGRAILFDRRVAQNAFVIGAVVVHQNKIIGRGHNQRELLHDSTAHAEILAITAASNYLNSKYLNECELYVTIEPCPMCASAIQQSRIRRIIFGAYDKVMGACETHLQIPSNISFGPKIDIIAPVMEEDCAFLLVDFFSRIRSKDGKNKEGLKDT